MSILYVVRVGNRDHQDEEAFETLDAAEVHARTELASRWKQSMNGTMPEDLDTAIEEFSSMSSSFDQMEIVEITVR